MSLDYQHQFSTSKENKYINTFQKMVTRLKNTQCDLESLVEA